MSIKIVDIGVKLRDYLLASDDISDLIDIRLYVGSIPKDKKGEAKSQPNPKVGMWQDGGDPRGANYRYKFLCRADSLQEAREVAILVANRLTNENFELEDDDGNNIAYWAELEGSLLDTADEVTGKPEVFFNINFESLY